ncbi:50S ribosomal protein L34 [Candidatus Dojkabacteria bacterium]|uniref:Large ribosomal subunit protein bL34 n=1 Tax=Candidatus Dojkabacteria bacterium TaxID=2099670 RepID=A0A955I5E9_9BACT|nr:50S ribosomal protein L34 [Candidatus Dojkabacteria bacterium]
MAKTKRTYQPSKTRRARRYGFRARSSSVGGKRVIKNRRNKGRKLLSPASTHTSTAKNKRLSRRR